LHSTTGGIMVAIAPPQVQAQPVYQITDDDKARQKAIQEAWKRWMRNNE